MITFKEEIYDFSADDGNGKEYVRICVILNRAARADRNGNFLIAIKITQGSKKRFFVNVNKNRISEEDYNAMCREYKLTKGHLKRYADIGNEVLRVFESINSIISNLVYEGKFSLEEFKIQWKTFNKVCVSNYSPYVLWRQVAKGRSAGTEANYICALNRFVSDMGDRLEIRDINRDLVLRWRDRMQNDGLSKTTINIYLRALRVVLNEAVKLNQFSDTKQLFDGLAIGGRNSYNNRKEQYLTVSQWKELWSFYESSGSGNSIFESWRVDKQHDRMEALGMMLFMYLADGMNLRDVLNLRYDDYYYQHGKKQLHFVRQKVAERTGVKVVFPILEQMRIIIERQGEDEQRDGLVFGYLKNRVRLNTFDKKDIKEERRLTALYNSTISDRMKYIAEAVGLNVFPTPTWCRHSFASNLIQAGVPKEYISASMAHSTNDTTDNYIDMYSYEQMVDYNSRLLGISKSNKEKLQKLISEMSNEEIMEIINQSLK